VAVEAGVLGRHDRLPQGHGDVVVADHDAPLGRELADDRAVEGLQACDRARRVIVERGNLGQIVTVGEEETRNRAGNGREHEQRDDAGTAGDANDEPSHSESSDGTCSAPVRAPAR
jgi:hypothetical protein